MTRTVTLLLLSALLAGCSPAVRSTVFVDRPPKPADQPIRVYRTLLPQCPYEEIGLVTSGQGNKFTSTEAALDALRTRAREMGGDAVIGLSYSEERAGGMLLPSYRSPVNPFPQPPSYTVVPGAALTTLSATVVRFTDPQCTK